MRTTIRLPEALLTRAKQRARSEGITLTALIERGLESVLQPPVPRAAVSLPVCTAGGGVWPSLWTESRGDPLLGLDVDNPGFRALYEPAQTETSSEVDAS
jgi:hypothetical protein